MANDHLLWAKQNHWGIPQSHVQPILGAGKITNNNADIAIPKY